MPAKVENSYFCHRARDDVMISFVQQWVSANGCHTCVSWLKVHLSAPTLKKINSGKCLTILHGDLSALHMDDMLSPSHGEWCHTAETGERVIVAYQLNRHGAILPLTIHSRQSPSHQADHEQICLRYVDRRCSRSPRALLSHFVAPLPNESIATGSVRNLSRTLCSRP